ncbi:hypothetical protein N7517_005716 [Penicillium concentricum]|uniref:Zn(2)-C6 fungal-type domain-containing protein n=1 Tax=Penicillium concentricum TaxID=293559 RepID=A0A9W9S952_9EURO|nr:uncharacterized protein N7517_005716 [Penicillium concentricum]KAJ5373710.1 hypothetical protein N7517_005716 [Penicillium concentricum]
MPGVPSSRGCDACRKVKKKVWLPKDRLACDQLKPTCSRCTRLKMTCVGGGQQRYMFKNQSLKAMQTQGAECQSELRSFFSGKEVVFVEGPKQVPSTETSLMAAAFVAAFQVTDIRYAVAYYGPFLRDIPRRLGSSTVLDSAVRALSTAYPFLHTGSYPPNVLVRYGQSLRALRECLNNPVEARTPNTLCAVYLITICQSWLGKHDDSLTSHSEAIAHLLRAARLNEWTSTFEMEMVITLCVPIILEGIANPRIKMDSEFWELTSSFKRRLSASRDNNRPQSTTELHHLAMFPKFVQNPEPHLAEIAKTYMQLRLDAHQIRQHLDQCREFTLVSFSSSEVARHSRIQAAYAILSTLAVLLNSILRVFDPWNASLVSEAVFFCNEITIQAKLASCYRPVGAGYIPLCLVVAWAASDNPVQLARIEAILSEYQSDFADVPWMSRAVWLASTLDRHRMRVMSGKKSPESPLETVSLADSGGNRDAGSKKPSARPESCCIL